MFHATFAYMASRAPAMWFSVLEPPDVAVTSAGLRLMLRYVWRKGSHLTALQERSSRLSELMEYPAGHRELVTEAGRPMAAPPHCLVTHLMTALHNLAAREIRHKAQQSHQEMRVPGIRFANLLPRKNDAYRPLAPFTSLDVLLCGKGVRPSVRGE